MSKQEQQDTFAAGYTAAQDDVKKASGGSNAGVQEDAPLDLERIRQMTPDEINADWERVSAVLGGQR